MITIDMSDAASAFAQAMEGNITPALVRATLRVAQEAAGELSEASMAVLTKRPTGSLARSFEASLGAVGTMSVEAVAGSRLPYARIQDEGGTIVAKRRRYLAIPMDGIPRGVRPREYGRELIFRRSKRGGGVLLEEISPAKGKQPARYKVRWVLKQSVRLTGTGYVSVAAEATEGLARAIVDAELARAAQEASRASSR